MLAINCRSNSHMTCSTLLAVAVVVVERNRRSTCCATLARCKCSTAILRWLALPRRCLGYCLRSASRPVRQWLPWWQSLARRWCTCSRGGGVGVCHVSIIAQKRLRESTPSGNIYPRKRKKPAGLHAKGKNVEATQAQQTGPNNPSELYAALGGVGNNTSCLRIPHLEQRLRATFSGVASQSRQHLSTNRSFINLASPNATPAENADLLVIKIPGIRVRQHYRQTPAASPHGCR
jgi:hypothetical protein